MVVLFVGDDWAEDHHDVWVMDEAGGRVWSGRLAEGLAGMARLHEVLAGLVEDPSEVVVGIETDRGLWVGALVAAGYRVFAPNPKSVARYRERHGVSGAKSDAGDAKVLADLVRTDRHNHREVAGDSAVAEGVKVLARAHQNLVWERVRHANRLRSALREFYPQALGVFDDLTHPDALSVLGKAPTPAQGARLSPTQIRTLLKQGGRKRYLDRRAGDIHTGLQSEALTAPPEIVDAFAVSVRATVAVIGALNAQIAQLAAELETRFEQHPDADIYLSIPGLGVVLSARVLGEFGDDPNRYADVKSRRNYAGTSPVTRASGKKEVVMARFVRNDRLYDPVIRWAFASLTASPGARAFYDAHREQGDSHYKALRALGNRLVGILHGCLRHHTLYDETTAWAHRQPGTAQAA